MPKKYNLRNVAAVTESLTRRERIEEKDVPSDNENENNEERCSGSESEEDAEEFSPPSEPEFVHSEEDEPPRKRGKLGKSKSHNEESSNRWERSCIIRGHDGHRWYRTAQEPSVHRLDQSVIYSPGPIGAAKKVTTPLDTWSLLFTDSIIKKIVLHTNEEIKHFLDRNEIEVLSDHTYSDVQIIEMKAFIGLLYFSGLQITLTTNLEDLWNPEYGSIMYRAAMSQNRFWFIWKNLRFDDNSTRNVRRATDKFAPIRELWQDFISNCTKYYNPASCCTIDEQIVSFRGRCPFKVYNDAKPDKYGMKIVMLNDSRTFYMYTAEPYVGKVVTDENESVPSYYIRKLSEPLHGTARNITCDNWFTSVEIFEKMLAEYSITMVGTLRKNKQEIPDSFKTAGAVSSSKFAFDGTKTLVSHTPKKNKIVLLLSTFHHTAEINQETEKPEIIHFYNTTKGGTYSFDQMCQEYSTARETFRWPMRILMAMLDQGGINAMILHNFNADLQNMDRRTFIKSLVKSLIEPHLRTRLLVPYLRRDLQVSISTILQEEKPIAPRAGPRKPARCAFCPRAKDRKVQVFCQRCQRAACEDHRTVQCCICVTVE